MPENIEVAFGEERSENIKFMRLKNWGADVITELEKSNPEREASHGKAARALTEEALRRYENAA